MNTIVDSVRNSTRNRDVGWVKTQIVASLVSLRSLTKELEEDTRQPKKGEQEERSRRRERET